MACGHRIFLATGNCNRPGHCLQHGELPQTRVLSGEPLIFITGPAPQFTRRGYVITIENGTLLVSLIGRFGDFPPTDKAGLIAFAKELHSHLAYQIIKDGEQLTPIAHQRFVSSTQRHYERMKPCPEGFVVIGDALCHFNPIYAQGMSAAAKQVAILQRILSDCAKQSRGSAGSLPPSLLKRPSSTARPENLPPAPTLHSHKPAAYAHLGRKSAHGISRSWISLR